MWNEIVLESWNKDTIRSSPGSCFHYHSYRNYGPISSCLSLSSAALQLSESFPLPVFDTGHVTPSLADEPTLDDLPVPCVQSPHLTSRVLPPDSPIPFSSAATLSIEREPWPGLPQITAVPRQQLLHLSHNLSSLHFPVIQMLHNLLQIFIPFYLGSETSISPSLNPQTHDALPTDVQSSTSITPHSDLSPRSEHPLLQWLLSLPMSFNEASPRHSRGPFPSFFRRSILSWLRSFTMGIIVLRSPCSALAIL